jgi:hypothetical protein
VHLFTRRRRRRRRCVCPKINVIDEKPLQAFPLLTQYRLHEMAAIPQ